MNISYVLEKFETIVQEDPENRTWFQFCNDDFILSQILCARGYTDQLSGLSGSLILLCGTLASFPMGLLAYKTGQPVLICKISSLFVIGSMVSLAYFMCVPDQGLAIVFSCAFMGIFALGVYPLALELIVECTYPWTRPSARRLSSYQGVYIYNFLHLKCDIFRLK